MCFQRVVERDRLQQVVANVGVQQEREGVVLVFEDLPNVVLVVLGEFRDGDIVTGFQTVFVDVTAHVLVAGVHEVDIPLLGPALGEIGDLVEVLVVVDEDRRRLVVSVLLGDLIDEVQRERRVLAAGPHDGGVLVLFETCLCDFDCLLDFVRQPRVIGWIFALAVGVIDVEILWEVCCHSTMTSNYRK